MWNKRLKEIVKRLPPTHRGVAVWDDYNGVFPKDQDVIGTITTNIGSSTPRNGIKIIEIYNEQDCNSPSNKEGVYRGEYGGVFDASYPTSRTRRGRVQEGGNICPTITCNCEGLRRVEPFSVAMRGRNPDNPSERGKSNGNYKQRIEVNMSGIANAITSVQKDSMVAEPKVCDTPHYRIRKLTPRECFRLQGVDDADIDTIQSAGISNSQQYKMAGNSITVDVLYHLFRKAFVDTSSESMVQTLF